VNYLRILVAFLPQRIRIKLLKTSWPYFLWSLLSNYIESIKLNYKKGVMQSYSQNGEDIICARYLPEENGSYIDVGCGQPVHDSNTFFLYKRGWSGIVIDPILNNYKLYRLLRRKDNFRKILIGCPTEEKGVDFYEFIPYLYSTTSPSVAQTSITNGRILKSVTSLQVASLSTFTPRIDPLSASLLSIDIEGLEMECLRTINFDTYMPRVICVEEWDETITSSQSEVREFLSAVNYSFVARTRLSSIFVHNEYLALHGELRSQIL
jgi:hypothetical protein